MWWWVIPFIFTCLLLCFIAGAGKVHIIDVFNRIGNSLLHLLILPNFKDLDCRI